jgi:hypothetical protein
LVETAFYGSNLVAARQAVEQILDIHYQLRMMGIPIAGPTLLFGDSQDVITRSTLSDSTLNKHHNALAYPCVCESIAAKILLFYHILSIKNPADILTKFIPYSVFCPLVEPLLFWKGDALPLPLLSGIPGGTSMGRMGNRQTKPGDPERGNPEPSDTENAWYSRLKGMRTHRGTNTEHTIVQHSVHKLSWLHNTVIAMYHPMIEDMVNILAVYIPLSTYMANGLVTLNLTESMPNRSAISNGVGSSMQTGYKVPVLWVILSILATHNLSNVCVSIGKLEIFL